MEIGISAGEASGAFLADELLPILQEVFPDAKYVGTGFNPREKDQLFEDWKQIAVNGFLPVLRVLPRLYQLKFKWQHWLKKPGSKYLILIDYPGFNLKLARWAQKHQIKVIYLAPPQVWIWKSHRIQLLKEIQCLCLFEHEHQYLQQRGIQSIEVGHPFFANKNASQTNLQDANQVILMPGSRWSRLRQQLPAMLQLWNNPANPHLELLEPRVLVPDSTSQKHICWIEHKFQIKVMLESQIDLSKVAYAWTIPGTVTLKYALRGLPMVVMSKLSPWSRIVAQRLLKSGFSFGLHSQLAGQKISDEWVIKKNMPPTIYLDHDQRMDQRQKCKQLNEKILLRPNFKETVARFLETLS